MCDRRRKINNELKDAGRGAIMYDAWSCAGVHYIGPFACCMKKVQIVDKGRVEYKEELGITLLSCAPMTTLVEDEDVISSNFNAEIHVNHFSSIFRDFYYVVRQ